MHQLTYRFPAAPATLPRLDALRMRICYHKSPSENLAHLATLAKCIGISAELFDVQNSATFVAAMEDAMLPPSAGVVLDVASLKEICRQDGLEKVAALIYNCNVSVLLLTTGVDESANRFLQVLTHGVVLEGDHAGAVARINFPEGLAGELSFQSYPRKPTNAIGLTLGPEAKADLIMKLEESPSFVRVSVGNASVFVWSSLRIFDVSRPLAAEKEFEDAADEYVPAIIFLRFAFKAQCWHNPSPGAGIVIDDPLLKKTYGFIHFPELLGSARKHGYHITLAFIPWNHVPAGAIFTRGNAGFLGQPTVRCASVYGMRPAEFARSPDSRCGSASSSAGFVLWVSDFQTTLLEWNGSFRDGAVSWQTGYPR